MHSIFCLWLEISLSSTEQSLAYLFVNYGKSEMQTQNPFIPRQRLNCFGYTKEFWASVSSKISNSFEKSKQFQYVYISHRDAYIFYRGTVNDFICYSKCFDNYTTLYWPLLELVISPGNRLALYSTRTHSPTG